MASINVRNGKLQADFRYKGRRCREQTRYTDTAANRRRLMKILERMEAEILLGTFQYRNYFPKSARADYFDELEKNELVMQQGGEKDTPTFADFAEIWHSEKRVEWRVRHYKSFFERPQSYHLPEFWVRKISNITQTGILPGLTAPAKEPLRKKGPLKASTINKTMNPIIMSMNEAAERYEFNSPATGIKSLKVQRTDIQPFTLEEVNLFLQHIREDFKSYYTVLFFT